MGVKVFDRRIPYSARAILVIAGLWLAASPALATLNSSCSEVVEASIMRTQLEDLRAKIQLSPSRALYSALQAKAFEAHRLGIEVGDLETSAKASELIAQERHNREQARNEIPIWESVETWNFDSGPGTSLSSTSADGTVFLSGGRQSNVLLLQRKNTAGAREIRLSFEPVGINVSANGKMAVASAFNNIAFIDLDRAKAIHSARTEDSILFGVVNKQGTFGASLSVQKVSVRNLFSGDTNTSGLEANASTVTLNSKGDLLFGRGKVPSLVGARAPLRFEQRNDTISSTAFIDDAHFVVGTSGGGITVWNDNFEETELIGLREPILQLSGSSDGRYVIARTAENLAIWDLQEPGVPMDELPLASSLSATFALNSQDVIVRYMDGKVERFTLGGNR